MIYMSFLDRSSFSFFLGGNDCPALVLLFGLLLRFRFRSFLRLFCNLRSLFLRLWLGFWLFVSLSVISFIFVFYLGNMLMLDWLGGFDWFGGLAFDIFHFRFGCLDGFTLGFFLTLDLLDLLGLSRLFFMFFLLVMFMLMMMVLVFMLVMLVVMFVLSLLALVFFAFLVGLSFFFGFSGMFSRLLFEGFRDVADCSPVFSMLFLLSSHFDEKPPVEDFFVEAVSDEMDGIDSGFEDDFERSRVVFFDFDEFEIWEGFFNIFLNSIEITFDQVERYVLDVVVHQLDLVNQLILFGENKAMFLLFFTLHQQQKSNEY